MLTVLPHKTLTVKRFATGTLVKGIFTKGQPTSLTITGSVSAATPNDIARLEEGKRTRQAYMVYTMSFLMDATKTSTPDWIYIGTDWYEVSAINSWSNLVMDHQEYLITKIENPQDYIPAPPVPVLSSATPGVDSVILTWASVDLATSYNTYYGAGTSVTKTTGTKITGVTSPKTITGLLTGTQYTFGITSVGEGGESELSNTISATPT